ncbi:MAG: hypothetical protein O7D34_12500, partial [Ignavibacteria bacterium]|nr:hypothetical protein [Ignavibacteria bacterium]
NFRSAHGKFLSPLHCLTSDVDLLSSFDEKMRERLKCDPSKKYSPLGGTNHSEDLLVRYQFFQYCGLIMITVFGTKQQYETF